MIDDYIFCPLCGFNEWKTNKMASMDEGKLTKHVCGDCKQFSYTNLTRLVPHPVFASITEVVRYSEVATIGGYYISIFHVGKNGPVSNIRDANSMELLLSFGKLVYFNWYREEEVTDKIKKYLVFS